VKAGLISRGAFLLIAAFWAAMNVWLWRAEYGPRSRGTPVPMDLVCRKILTAPEASSLSVYQDGQRLGFCEFSTSVEQQMAELDENQPPPDGFLARAGYQIRLTGNVPFGDFTNRVKFDGRVRFSPRREWRELNFKMSTHFATADIYSLATNRTVSLQITNMEDGSSFSRVFTFEDVQNPNTLLQTLGQISGDGGLGSGLDWPFLPPGAVLPGQAISWEAQRVRLTKGHEAVSAYRLETSVLGQPIVIYVSTLGEILRVELPGGVTAALDEWSKS
jgi:hypothetical protein